MNGALGTVLVDEAAYARRFGNEALLADLHAVDGNVGEVQAVPTQPIEVLTLELPRSAGNIEVHARHFDPDLLIAAELFERHVGETLEVVELPGPGNLVQPKVPQVAHRRQRF